MPVVIAAEILLALLEGAFARAGCSADEVASGA